MPTATSVLLQFLGAADSSGGGSTVDTNPSEHIFQAAETR